MGSKAGLKKVTKSVRGKHGAVRRTYWVRAKQEGGKFLQKHKGKLKVAGAVLGATALAAGAHLAHKHRGAIGERASAANKAFAGFRRGTGASLTKKLVSAAGNKLAEHAGESLGSRVGGGIGRMIGGRHGEAFGQMLGGTLGGTAASHLSEGRIERAATRAGQRVRESGYRRKGGKFVAT
jgi:hypothetical protein